MITAYCCTALIISLMLSRVCSLLLQDIVIQQDDEIRLKIVGTRVDKNDIVNDLLILFTFSIRTIYFVELN